MDPRLQELLNKFTAREMTAQVNHLPRVPTRISQLGLFTNEYFRTNAVELEEMTGQIEILDPSVRDSPPSQLGNEERNRRVIAMEYFSKEAVVRPQEVAGLVAEGAQTELVQIASVITRKLERLRQNHDLTLEYERIGAIKGVITKRDGSTVRENLFTLFGVTQQTQDFVFGTSSSDIKAITRSAKRKARIGLGGSVSATGFTALCGAEFFDRLVNHPSVKELYVNQARSMDLNNPNDVFQWQGINWEVYEGSVGGTDFVADGEAHLVPLGVPGLFRSLYGPVNTMGSVNQIAQEMYINRKEFDYDKGLGLLYESNHISICTKPRSVIKLYSSN